MLLSLSFCGGRLRRGRPRIRGLTPSPSARPSSVVSACPSPLPFVTPCRGCCAWCAATPLNADCPFGHHRPSPRGHVRGVPPHPRCFSVLCPVFFVFLSAVSRCSSLSLLSFPSCSSRPVGMSACLAATRARPCPGRDAIPGQRFGAAPSFAVIALIHDQLAYKAAWAGRQLIEVNPRYTSQACSTCGGRRSKPDGSERWRCEHCGAEHDRDVNAAINIDRAGILALGSRSGGRAAA